MKLNASCVIRAVPAGTSKNSRIVAGVVVLAVAGLGAFLILRSRHEEMQSRAVAEETETVKEMTAAAPAAKQEIEQPAVLPASPKRGGIRVGSFAEGSLADLNAPDRPLSDYVAKREATLKKWRDSKVSLTLQESNLQDLVAQIKNSTGLLLNLDPLLAPDLSFSMNLCETPGDEAMSFLTEVSELAWVIDGDGSTWLVPKDKLELYEKPDARQLRMIATLIDSLAEEALRVAPGSREKTVAGLLDGKRLGLSMKDLWLDNAMSILASTYGLQLNWNRELLGKALESTVSLDLEDATAREALNSMLGPLGLEFAICEGSVWVGTSEALARRVATATAAEEARVLEAKARAEAEANVFQKTVAIEASDLAIRDVAERISKALGIGYVVDPATWSRAARYGFDGEPHALKEIFEALGKGAPVRVVYREGKLWYLSTTPGK